MKHRLSCLLMLTVSLPFSSALACEEITPEVGRWVECGFATAGQTKDRKFMSNFAVAKFNKKRLLPTAQPRWNALEKRILARCGTFESAAQADQSNLKKLNEKGAYYVPSNQFEAIAGVDYVQALAKN
jgi:hypothetical protein